MTKAREAEMHYVKEQNDLEIKKSSEMAEIETKKFEQMVNSIGAQTIQSIATAGPDMQVSMIMCMVKSPSLDDCHMQLELYIGNQSMYFLNQNITIRNFSSYDMWYR